MSTAEERMQDEIDELEQENRLLRARNTRLEAAAQRQWVGLSNEQKLSLEIQGGKSDIMLAELVEGWLKEKNL